MEILNLIKNLTDIKKPPMWILLVISVLTGFLLNADDELLKRLKLDRAFEDYGSEIGMLFLISITILLVFSALWIIRKLYEITIDLKERSTMKLKVKQFAPDEQSVLREFYILGKSSLEMPIDDPTISRMINQNILIINNQLGSSFIMRGTSVSLSISPIVQNLLKPEDIGLSNEPNDKEKEFVLKKIDLIGLKYSN